jgi:hypothetical protein
VLVGALALADVGGTEGAVLVVTTSAVPGATCCTPALADAAEGDTGGAVVVSAALD